VREAGIHRFEWDGRDDAGRRLSSGLYFVRVTAAERHTVEKIVLLRTR
jgi:flagellar hook assembly protein FlgD